MLRSSLREVLHRRELSRKDKLLLVLAEPDNLESAKTISDVKQIAMSNGLCEVKNWNVSSILERTTKNEKEKRAVRIDEGWLLTSAGYDYLESQGLLTAPVPKVTAADLRQHLGDISNAETVAFLSEAISCVETKLFRAAVVLSWVGAISLLYEYVVQHRLADFNAEAKSRNTRWKDAVTVDDIARMKEHDFLDILENLSILGKNVKQELQGNCLKLRNSCGHPNSFKLGQRRVAAHVEILILNVFSKFS